MSTYSAFQSLSVLIAEQVHDSAPSTLSDTFTPRTWSAPPSRAASIEPHVVVQDTGRDVVDVRGSRDQTRRKPRFSSNQIPDVMPADRWD